MMADSPDNTEPERRLLGIPYDWRRPTGARIKSRTWNPAERRIVTPTPFGHGHVINGYWLAHPIRFWRSRRRH